VLGEWARVLDTLETDPLKLSRECDWVAKYHLVDDYRRRHDLPLSHPRVAMLDLQYHDVNRRRGLYYLLQRRDKVDRIVKDAEIRRAMRTPPQTTRAKLRGEFIRQAKRKRRDFTVDWVHLKLNDQAQRTVLCKDPFRSQDDRVQKLIASM
jgi:proteasome accessory factor A